MYGLEMRRKQLDLFLQNKKNPDPFFGGSKLKSNPKVARPISTKDYMHVVLKSDLAKGALSFLRIERVLISLVQNLGLKLNVKVKDVVVMTNHIHLAIKVRHRRHFKAYLRALTGLIVRKIIRIKKTLKVDTSAPSDIEKFFKGRPFSRIVDSGRKSFCNLMRYFELNRLEKCGYSKAESRVRGLVGHGDCALVGHGDGGLVGDRDCALVGHSDGGFGLRISWRSRLRDRVLAI